MSLRMNTELHLPLCGPSPQGERSFWRSSQSNSLFTTLNDLMSSSKLATSLLMLSSKLSMYKLKSTGTSTVPSGTKSTVGSMCEGTTQVQNSTFKTSACKEEIMGGILSVYTSPTSQFQGFLPLTTGSQLHFLML